MWRVTCKVAGTLARLNRLGEVRETFQDGIAAARKQGDQHAAEEMAGFLEELE